jgi:dihydropyrimidinase
MIHHFGVGEGASRSTGWSSSSRRTPRSCSASIPRKGTIAPGSDADLVIFDPTKTKTITVADQHSKTDYNLYEGTAVNGDVETVLVRGTVVVDEGELRVEPGFGQFVARAKFGEELRPAATHA